MKKIIKIVGIILACFIALFAAVGIVISIMFPKEKIIAMVVPHIETTLDRKVEIKDAGISLFPILGVKIKGLQISNTKREGFGKDAFVGLDEFLISIKVSSLFQKKLNVGKVILKRPAILVEIGRDGTFNFDDLAVMAKDTTKEEVPEEVPPDSAAAPALPIPVTLEKFIIKNGHIVYHDMKAGMKAGIGEINQRVDISVDKELKNIITTGELLLTGISFLSKDVPKPITGLTVSLNHDIVVNMVDSKVTINSVKASLQKIYIALSGTVNSFNTVPELDLKLKSDKIFINELLAEIPVEMVPDIAKLKAQGWTQLDVAISGKVEPEKLPSVNGKLELKDITIKYTDLPKSLNNLNADIGFTENSLNIKELAMKFGDNPINIKAIINNFAKPEVDAVVKVDFNLDDAKDITKLPDGVDVGGKIKADVVAKGLVDPADPLKLDIKGKVDVNNVMVVSPPLTKPVFLNGAFSLSAEEIKEDMAIKIGSSSMQSNVTVTDFLSLVFPDSTKKHPRPNINFRLTSPLLNVDEFMAKEDKATAPSKPKAPPAQTASTGGADHPILAEPLPKINLAGNVSCSRFVYEGIELSGINSGIKLINDILDVSLNGGLYNGKIVSNYHFDLKSISNISFNILFNVLNVDLNSFISHFNDRLSDDTKLNKSMKNTDDIMYGRLSLKTNFTGNGGTASQIQKNLKGNIYGESRDGKIASCLLLKKMSKVVEKFYKIDDINFKKMDFNARIADENLYIDTLNINSNAGDFGVTGKVSFTAQYDLLVADRLTKKISQKIVGVQDKGKSAVKGVLEKSKLGFVSGAVDKAGIPTDKDGRVTLLLGVEGDVAGPKIKFKGFGKGEGTKSDLGKEAVTEQLKTEVEKVVKEKVEEVKQEAKKVIEQETKKVEEKVKTETKKVKKDIKKKGIKKLKKLF